MSGLKILAGILIGIVLLIGIIVAGLLLGMLIKGLVSSFAQINVGESIRQGISNSIKGMLGLN
jgi:hypothetical protein